MIRLKDLLAEISLGSVTPYATQFVWRDNWGDGESWEARFEAVEGGVDEPQMTSSIMMTMTKWTTSRHSDSGEWQFAYFVRTKDDNGWTTTTRYSAASGHVNTFRLFRTIGEAIRDFANTQPDVDVIDISGSDTYDAKGAQKSRIYVELLRTNPDLREFNILADGTHVYLIRKTAAGKTADSTGIEDDYWSADGSETDTSDDAADVPDWQADANAQFLQQRAAWSDRFRRS
jgi:hypothetical protein